MPIECSVCLTPLNQEKFHELDREVMKHAFAVHNELGRFFDEDIYKTELTRRCQQAGIPGQREVTISVVHETFRKDFYLDMLLAHGAIYELKCAAVLMARHEGQLINYLLLTGIQHGKLINFRSRSVESRFVSTGLTYEKRRMFRIDRSGWDSGNERTEFLENLVLSLLEDWGAFLTVSLYTDAIIHFLGGEEKVVCPLNVICNREIIGTKNVCLLTPGTAIHLSALTQRLKEYETHLVRQFSHMELNTVQWINFSGNHIIFRTIPLKK